MTMKPLELYFDTSTYCIPRRGN